MARYKFLSTNQLSLQSIWAWAKRLVDDLNKRDSDITGVPAGSLVAHVGAAVPEGWFLCDGTMYSKAAQPELFIAIGYAYGGANEMFAVPDLRDRVLMGAGALVGLGSEAGASTVTLTENELPAHTHGIDDPTHTHAFTAEPHTHEVNDPGHVHSGGVAAPANAATGADVGGSGNTGGAVTGITLEDAVVEGSNANAATGVTVLATGAGKAFSVLNPVFGVNMIIKA